MIFGGVNQVPQVNELKMGVDVLIATPGRLLDLHKQGFIDLNHMHHLVLDEADKMLDMGFYEGVNLSLAYCDDCGHQELEMDVCPKCGSENLTKIDRMNGYLSYSRVHGDTRLNDAKMAEIAERMSM